MFLLSNLNNVTYLHASSCILQGFLLLCLSEWFIHSTHKFLDCQEFPPWKGVHSSLCLEIRYPNCISRVTGRVFGDVD